MGGSQRGWQVGRGEGNLEALRLPCVISCMSRLVLQFCLLGVALPPHTGGLTEETGLSSDREFGFMSPFYNTVASPLWE